MYGKWNHYQKGVTTKEIYIYRFGRAHKRKFVEVVKNELKRLGSIKVSFRLRQEFFFKGSVQRARSER